MQLGDKNLTNEKDFCCSFSFKVVIPNVAYNLGFSATLRRVKEMLNDLAQSEKLHFFGQISYTVSGLAFRNWLKLTTSRGTLHFNCKFMFQTPSRVQKGFETAIGRSRATG